MRISKTKKMQNFEKYMPQEMRPNISCFKNVAQSLLLSEDMSANASRSNTLSLAEKSWNTFKNRDSFFAHNNEIYMMRSPTHAFFPLSAKHISNILDIDFLIANVDYQKTKDYLLYVQMCFPPKSAAKKFEGFGNDIYVYLIKVSEFCEKCNIFTTGAFARMEYSNKEELLEDLCKNCAKTFDETNQQKLKCIVDLENTEVYPLETILDNTCHIPTRSFNYQTVVENAKTKEQKKKVMPSAKIILEKSNFVNQKIYALLEKFLKALRKACNENPVNACMFTSIHNIIAEVLKFDFISVAPTKILGDLTNIDIDQRVSSESTTRHPNVKIQHTQSSNQRKLSGKSSAFSDYGRKIEIDNDFYMEQRLTSPNKCARDIRSLDSMMQEMQKNRKLPIDIRAIKIARYYEQYVQANQKKKSEHANICRCCVTNCDMLTNQTTDFCTPAMSKSSMKEVFDKEPRKISLFSAQHNLQILADHVQKTQMHDTLNGQQSTEFSSKTRLDPSRHPNLRYASMPHLNPFMPPTKEMFLCKQHMGVVISFFFLYNMRSICETTVDALRDEKSDQRVVGGDRRIYYNFGIDIKNTHDVIQFISYKDPYFIRNIATQCKISMKIIKLWLAKLSK